VIRLGALHDVLDPFAVPRSVVRNPRRGRAAMWPDLDAVTITVTAGDLMKLQVLLGYVTVDQVRKLPMDARPSIELIMELERLDGALESAGT
jgi:hypothetical protein